MEELKQPRKNVTFTDQQLKLIELGVQMGMALNDAEYIRRAVDELNKSIPIYRKLKSLMDSEKDLDKIDELLDNI